MAPVNPLDASLWIPVLAQRPVFNNCGHHEKRPGKWVPGPPAPAKINAGAEEGQLNRKSPRNSTSYNGFFVDLAFSQQDKPPEEEKIGRLYN